MGNMGRPEKLSVGSTVAAGLVFAGAGFALSATLNGVLQGFAAVAGTAALVALVAFWWASHKFDIQFRTVRASERQQQLVEELMREQARRFPKEMFEELIALRRLAEEMEAKEEESERHAWRTVRVLVAQLQDETEDQARELEKLQQVKEAILAAALPPDARRAGEPPGRPDERSREA